MLAGPANRAALGAAGAADADRLVLDDGRVLRQVRPRPELPAEHFLHLGGAGQLVQADELQAGRRTDLDAAAAQDAAVAVEDRVDAAVETARRLPAGGRLVVAALHRRGRVLQAVLDRQHRDR